MTAPERLVLNFHGIGEPGSDVPTDEHRYWCPEDEWPPLVAALAAVRDAGRVPLQITFDDGNRSDVDVALPSLLEWGLTATFFVCAGRLTLPGYVGEGGLATLLDAGMAIGSHGWDHVDLRGSDDAALRLETEESRMRLAGIVGGVIDEFAIPFGSYDRRVLGRLRGYRTVYTSDGGRTGTAGWLTPRTSYVRGWSAQTISRLADRPPSVQERLLRRTRRAVKSLR